MSSNRNNTSKRNNKIRNAQRESNFSGSINTGYNTSVQYSNVRKRKRTQRSNVRRKRIRQQRSAGSRVSHGELPEINNKPIQTRCIRYYGTLNGTSIWKSSDILAFVGFTNSGATPYYPLLDSFKLIRVGVILLPDGASSAGTVSFTWNGANAPEIRETMLVTNAVPFQKSFYPMVATSAWEWWDNSSTASDLFSLRSTLSTDCQIYLDIEIQYILNTGAIASVPLTTTSSVTGLVYRSLPITGLNFNPVDLDTDI